MMNIGMISSQLKYLPDQVLVKEMQTPSGTVPQFLIMSELQRRQQMRASMPAQPPTSTVAQDILSAQARPPQGNGLPQSPISAPSAAPGAGMMPNVGQGTVPTMGGMRPNLPAQGGIGSLQRMFKGGVVLPRRSGFNQRGPEGYYADGGDVQDPDPAYMRNLLPFWQRQVSPYAARASVDMDDPNAPGYDTGLQWAGAGIKALTQGPFLPGDAAAGLTNPYGIYGTPRPLAAAARTPAAEAATPYNARSSKPSAPSPDDNILMPVSPKSTTNSGRSTSDHHNPSSIMDLPGNYRSPPAAPPETSDADYLNMIKEVENSGLFPQASGTQGLRDKLEQQIEAQHKQSGWLSLADAGFRTASGMSPFAAANIGQGLAGLGQEVQQNQTAYLKNQLELAGMASKEAEAEATRRVNIANVATKFMDARQRAQEMAYNSQNQYYARMDANDARRLGYANLAEAREARIANQQDTQTARYYSALTSQIDAESRLADAWDFKKSQDIMHQMPTSNPHLARIQALQQQMAAFSSRMPGAPQGIQQVQPAAANPRDPLGLR